MHILSRKYCATSQRPTVVSSCPSLIAAESACQSSKYVAATQSERRLKIAQRSKRISLSLLDAVHQPELQRKVLLPTLISVTFANTRARMVTVS